jgi:hypothetical protein
VTFQQVVSGPEKLIVTRSNGFTQECPIEIVESRADSQKCGGSEMRVEGGGGGLQREREDGRKVVAGKL